MWRKFCFLKREPRFALPSHFALLSPNHTTLSKASTFRNKFYTTVTTKNKTIGNDPQEFASLNGFVGSGVNWGVGDGSTGPKTTNKFYNSSK